MQQHELAPPKGATHKRKRVGRGNASGHGTYSTKGMKGQKARAGGGVAPWFEGGQLSFTRRMARKRGFTNPFRVDYEEVNVGDLARFKAGDEVNADALRMARLIRTNRPVKVLGNGDLSVKLTVEADSFSKSAREKIEAAGGSVRWINGEPEPKPEKPVPPPARKTPKAEAGEKPAKAEKAPKGEKAPKAPKAAKTEDGGDDVKPEPAAAEETDDGAGS
jgi:large subunit ribosomal protein L15